MNENAVELAFGITSTLLYIMWGASALPSPEPHRAWMLWCYAAANIAILWPVIQRAWL